MLPIYDENPSRGSHAQLLAIILLNALALPFTTEEGVMAFGFIPGALNPYSWLTSQFLHADIAHLAGNMWFLWLFGDNVEARLGRWFLPFYLMGGAAAATLHAMIYPFSTTPMVGASGAVSAVLGFYLVLWPRARLTCLAPLGRGLMKVNISALLFAVLYVLIQLMGLFAESRGVAYGAHLGGLLLGVVVSLLVPRRSEEEVALSGPSGESPLMSPTRREIARALRSGDEEYAVDLYIRELRRDPYLELPELEQLLLAEKLAEGGRPHLAKAALEKFLLRHPFSQARAQAHLLLGHVEETDFMDYEAAARRYREALAAPSATDETRLQAQERLKRASAVLEKTFIAGESDQELYAILQESASAPASDQMRAIPEEVNARMTGTAGILVRNASRAEASRLAEAFERARVPVVVIPRRLMLELPQVIPIDGLSSDGDRLALSRGSAVTEIEWKECLLMAVYAVTLSGLARKETGVLDVGLETLGGQEVAGVRPAEYVDEARLAPCFEVVSLSPPGRYRWMARDMESLAEFPDTFYPAVRDAVINSLMVPVNAGVQASLAGEIPAFCRFKDFDESDRYMSWQIQLANLKERKLYR